MMIVYHVLFDLSQLYGWDIDVLHGFWKLFARTTAGLFLILVGVSGALSLDRIKDRSSSERWAQHLKRFMTVGTAALAVTMATFVADQETYVRFGVLHLIAVAALILPLFALFKESAIAPGIAFITLGPWINTVHLRSSIWLPLGITYPGFTTIDYFPLIPWFGVILIGYGIGYFLYIRKKFSFLNSHFSILSLPGRHSLLLYLIHQPVILLILWLILGVPRL